MLKRVSKVNFIFDDVNDLYSEYKDDIAKFWKKYSQKHDEVFDGDVLSVMSIEEDSLEYMIHIAKIKFSEVMYGKLVGNIQTRSLFSGGYLLTNDGYIGFALGKNNLINLIGGLPSKDDFVGDSYRPELCLRRECKEETGLDILSDDFNYELKYIKCPNDNQSLVSHYPIGTIYEIETKYNKSDLENIFQNLAHDKELKSFVFFKANEYSLWDDFNKKDYIDELVELIVHDMKNEKQVLKK